MSDSTDWLASPGHPKSAATELDVRATVRFGSALSGNAGRFAKRAGNPAHRNLHQLTFGKPTHTPQNEQTIRARTRCVQSTGPYGSLAIRRSFLDIGFQLIDRAVKLLVALPVSGHQHAQEFLAAVRKDLRQLFRLKSCCQLWTSSRMRVSKSAVASSVPRIEAVFGRMQQMMANRQPQSHKG